MLKKLAAHANASPQNVYKLFILLAQHKMTFRARTTPKIEHLLNGCEKLINDKLLPNLLKNPSTMKNTGITFVASKGGTEHP